MKNRKLLALIPVVTIVVILIIVFRQPIQFFFGNLISRGSISKDDAVATKCGTKNTICRVNSGKITSSTLSTDEVKKMEQQYNSPREMNIQYAENVSAAVHAIRAYTGVGNLDVSLLQESTPLYVSYYCTKYNKCWAVDNETHKVVPHAR